MTSPLPIFAARVFAGGGKEEVRPWSLRLSHLLENERTTPVTAATTPMKRPASTANTARPAVSTIFKKRMPLRLRATAGSCTRLVEEWDSLGEKSRAPEHCKHPR